MQLTERMQLNQELAEKVLGLKPILVATERCPETGHPEAILQKSSLHDKTEDRLAVASDNPTPVGEYMDIVFPLDDDDEELVRLHRQDREDLIIYGSVVAADMRILPDYTASLDSIAEVESKVIEVVGYSQYAAALTGVCPGNPMTANAMERAQACLLAIKSKH